MYVIQDTKRKESERRESERNPKASSTMASFLLKRARLLCTEISSPVLGFHLAFRFGLRGWWTEEDWRTCNLLCSTCKFGTTLLFALFPGIPTAECAVFLVHFSFILFCIDSWRGRLPICFRENSREAELEDSLLNPMVDSRSRGSK